MNVDASDGSSRAGMASMISDGSSRAGGMGTLTSIASGKKIRRRWSLAHDIQLLQCIMEKRTHKAPWGSGMDRYTEVATMLVMENAVPWAIDWKGCRDRFSLLVRYYRKGEIDTLRSPGSDDEFKHRQLLLEKLVSELNSGNEEREESVGTRTNGGMGTGTGSAGTRGGIGAGTRSMTLGRRKRSEPTNVSDQGEEASDIPEERTQRRKQGSDSEMAAIIHNPNTVWKMLAEIEQRKIEMENKRFLAEVEERRLAREERKEQRRLEIKRLEVQERTLKQVENTQNTIMRLVLNVMDKQISPQDEGSEK